MRLFFAKTKLLCVHNISIFEKILKKWSQQN